MVCGAAGGCFGEKLWNRVETNIVVMKDAIMQRLHLTRSFKAVTAFHCVSWVTVKEPNWDRIF